MIDKKVYLPLYKKNSEKAFKKEVNFTPLPSTQYSKTIVPNLKVSKPYRFTSRAGLITYRSCQCDVSQVRLWVLNKFNKYHLINVIISKQELTRKTDSQHGGYTKPEYILRIYFNLKRRLETRNVNFFDIPSVVSDSSYHPVVTTNFSDERNSDSFRRKSGDHEKIIHRLLSYHVGRLNDETMLFVSSNISSELLTSGNQFPNKAIALCKEHALEVLRKKKLGTRC